MKLLGTEQINTNNKDKNKAYFKNTREEYKTEQTNPLKTHETVSSYYMLLLL